MVDHMFNHGGVGRMDIRTGVGRRRRWTAEAKGMIVAASFAPGANVSEVARRHEISPQHLFQWRNAAKAGRLVLPADDAAMFAPVVLDNCTSAGVARDDLGLVLEIAGVIMRVNRHTDMDLVTAAVRALKAAG